MDSENDSYIQSLNEGYDVRPEAAQEALQNRSVFNVIDYQTGGKVDFIIRKDRAFSLEEFKRRISANILGLQVSIIFPEDAILSKLKWLKESQSERQFRDALGVAVVQWQRLDKVYLWKWARELSVAALLGTLLSHAEKLQLP